ncbi:MAG TPA: glycosyltransferase family 39 protein [Solirubrobacteraceae bacterium]
MTLDHGRTTAPARDVAGGLSRRWRALDGDARAGAAGLGVLLVGAIALRVWLMAAYGPAFVGFGDSHEYVLAAMEGVFRDVQKPAGYPIFLGALHGLSDTLQFATAAQHALGIATALLLYAAVRRAGAPAWLGLLPAAVVLFGGTGLLLEHALLADPLFAFLQAAGLYCGVRALRSRELRWPLLAGLAIGASFWVKTVGLSSALLLPALLLCAAPGGARRRMLSAASATAVVLAAVLAYTLAQGAATGYWGYERQGAWNLYGRVATFVDCARFTPPPGTAVLCPSEPPGRRQSESYYQYAPGAPAVRMFGGPAHAPASANALLQRFSVAAIESEPAAFAGAVLRGLTFYVAPRWGEGYTPRSIREALLEPRGTRSVEPAIAAFYPRERGYAASPAAVGPLSSYESATRIEGPLLVLLLASAVLGIAVLPRGMRSAGALFTLTALASVALAEAGNGYDARYGYPAYGALAAGAALGAWAIGTRLLAAHPRSRARSAGARIVATRAQPGRPRG